MSEEKYSGRELIRAATGQEQDILRVILDPDQLYSLGDVDRLRSQYLRKKVVR